MVFRAVLVSYSNCYGIIEFHYAVRDRGVLWVTAMVLQCNIVVV
jgi:hypothetical protein